MLTLVAPVSTVVLAMVLAEREVARAGAHTLSPGARRGARAAIFEYVEAFYNRRRRHSGASGYKSPWSSRRR